MKRLILLRHAHRDVENRDRDNGLSKKGEEQVKKMLEFSRHRLENTKPFLISSPKKRCQQTIAPLAEHWKQTVETDLRVDEGSFQIDEFLDAWKYEGADTTVVCSHGDIIPIMVYKLTGYRIGIKKSGWIELEYDGSEVSLTWIVQKHY